MSGALRTGEFYGAILRKGGCSGIVLSELLHGRARRLPCHWHESAYFCLLLSGSYRERVGARLIDYQPFTVGFHPSAFAHSDEIGREGGRFFCVEVGERWIDRLREYAPKFDSTPHLCGEEVTWLATRLYSEYKSQGFATALAIEGLVLEMLALVARTQDRDGERKPRWLARVVELLHEEFSRSLRLEEVAAEVDVHPVHLSRVFRRAYGQTLGEYLNRVRVVFASRELTRREVRLVDVAARSGFADQSHFTRVFKKVTGRTPGAFRAALPSCP